MKQLNKRLLDKFEKTLFVLTLLFLPTQFGKHFWPDFSYVSGLRSDYLSPTLYLTDVFIFLLMVTWLFPLFKFSTGRRNFKLKIIKHSIWMLFPLALAAGIIFSQNPLAGIYGMLKLAEFFLFGLYVAKRGVRLLDLQKIAFIFSFGIIFESLLASAQFLSQSSIGGIFYFFGERTFLPQTPGIANVSLNGELVMRPYGTFSHPNVLAGYLTIAFAMVISNIKYQIPARSAGGSNRKKIFFYISLIFGSIAVFLTMSRVAIIVWLLVSGLWFMQKKFSILSVLSILALCVFFFLSPFISRFTELKLDDESIVVREELIKNSFQIILDHPFFGVGLYNFLYHIAEFSTRNTSLFTRIQPVHNIYLLVASETGIIGLSFFIWFLFNTYKRIMRGENNELRIKKKMPIIHNSRFIILSLVVVLGFFDHYFLTLQQGQLLLAFVLGYCCMVE